MTEPPPFAAPTGLPWALPLAEIEDAPFALPTAPGGVWLQAAPGAEASTAHAVEAATLVLLQALPWRHAQVQVVDFGIRKRFAALAQLQPLGLYHLHADPQDAQRALAELERLARHRHHQLLDESTPTLADYNQSALQPEPYQLLLLNLDDFPTDLASAQRLSAVLREGAAAGFFVMAFGRQELAGGNDAAGPGPEARNAATQAMRHTLAALYPQVAVAAPPSPGAPAPLTLLGGPGTDGLAAVLARHASPIMVPLEPLAPQLARLREQAAAEEAREPEQDFLQVPVGTTLDGREPVQWRMGARSGCYNALMLGMPGSGKSTLLNNLIVGIAERYSARQLRLYLMDYKDGVEFQAFAQHPNVERIFLDNEDTAAATRLLEEFQATIHARNERFKALQANVRNLDEHNRLCPDAPLPRILLVVDEAQRLLSMSDRRSARFADLLVDVTRRGRSAGVHILLSTQSLQGVSDVNRLKVAISLRASFMLNSQSDAESVLDARNGQAPLQLRKYEFVLNGDSGRPGVNVLARGLPSPEVAQRVAAARASRPAHDCTTAEVVCSPQAAVADQPMVAVAPPAVAAPPAELYTTSAAVPEEEDVLARVKRLTGIVPQLPPVPENPT